MIHNKDMETISREDLEQLQIERLQLTLNRVYRNVAFYSEIFDKNKINIEKIKNISDIEKLPFTTKEDLRKSYPYNMFSVPLKDIVRIHSSSGTTGHPIVVGYTKNDIKIWEELVARNLVAAGLTSHDLLQIAYNYGLFTGGLGFHYAAELLGISVIPSSTNHNFAKQIMIMKDYKTTALACTPSYAIQLGIALKESGAHPEELFLKVGIFGAEPWSEKIRKEIEDSLHITAYDSYGLSEIIGPGVAFECEERNGMHVNEDHFIVEIINPDTLKHVKEGEEGELVFTTVTKEGFPLIRYRTGDISSFIIEKCGCGRTFRKIARIKKRTDDLIFINESKFFPSQIDEILLKTEGLTPHYQIVLDKRNGIDTIELLVEVPENISFFGEISKLEKLQSDIESGIESQLEIKVKVKLVEPKSLKFSYDNKISRVIDNRNR